jgi:choline/glycine/proline betaine transport protein
MQHINRAVFFFSAGFILLFVMMGALWPGPEAMGNAFGHIQSFVINHLGWFYIVSVGFFLLFVLWLLVSPYGKVRLGKDNEEPEFSNFTWFAMLFSAGMGIGLLFYSVAEPVIHFDNPPRVASGSPAAESLRELQPQLAELEAQREAIEAEQPERAAIEEEYDELAAQYADARATASSAAREATTITFFHWGLHAWAIYIVMGLSLAYFSFRHDLPLTIRSAFYPLLGDRIHGPIGYTIEILAVVGTMFGVATSLGLGAMQITAGLDHLGLIALDHEVQEGEARTAVPAIIVIVVITIIATISVMTGLKVGIRRLSELNLLLGLALMVFVAIAGPTVFLLSSFVQSVGGYAQSLVELTFRTDAFRGLEWQEHWTMFYWAWWIAWSPFVGMFIARISRGRTIREFIAGVLLVPLFVSFLIFTVFGHTGIYFELTGREGIAAATEEAFEFAFFAMLEFLPLATITSAIAIVIIATFFITSSDSGSLVDDIHASGGSIRPHKVTRIYWAVAEGVVAAGGGVGPGGGVFDRVEKGCVGPGG